MRRTRLAVVAVAGTLALVACKPGANPSAPDGGIGNANPTAQTGPGGGLNSGGSGGSGGSTINPAFKPTVSAWTTASTTFPGILYHAAAVQGNAMYVVGGINGSFNLTPTVYAGNLATASMTLAASGSLPFDGTQIAAGSLADGTQSGGICSNQLLVDGSGKLHLVGGQDGTGGFTPAASASWSTASGTDTFSLDGGGGALPATAGRYNYAGAAYGNFLYVLGGSRGQNPSEAGGQPPNTNTAFVGTVSGSTVTWNTTTYTLPVTTAQGGAVVVAVPNTAGTGSSPYLYLVGGVNGTVPVADVYVAALNPSTGAIGAWTKTASLPIADCFELVVGATQSVSISGTASQSAFVYAVGGLAGGLSPAATNKVFYAQANSDGSLNAWNTMNATLPQALMNVVGGIDAQQRIWVAGGTKSDQRTPSNAIYEAQLGL